MKATELRIGSWVTHPAAVWSHRSESQGYGHVDFQWEEKDWLGVAECTINLEDVKPIPLTEEWLERFNWNPPKDIGVSFSLTTDEIHFVAGNYYKKIEYVHQLQNLYFALTNSELEIND
jgi:hypothetical protein